jgi:predicted  nucleic acid-binding Zn-ribbon protein
MATHEQEHDDPPRPFSIDLTLELERQLDNESNPNSPVDATGRPHSLDPHVLASIITQLRLSLADVTKERDELSQTVVEVRAREAGTADTLGHMTEKCSKMQEELDNARTKIKDDEDTISILRTKVEESRRGLMRLQSENRRASQVPSALDLSRAGIPSFNGPPSSKRASLIGSTTGRNNAHKRISSVADNAFSLDGSHLTSPVSTPTPATFTLPDVQKSRSQQPSHTRRMSGMFGRASPPQSLFPSEEFSELEMLRRELNAVKAELDDVKHELSETNEAREASETCVKALREFIEENQVGAVPKSLSPLPAEVKKAPPSAAAGWGFKLWRADSLTQSPPLASPSPAVHTVSPSLSSLTPPVPLAKKLGDFFGTRATTTAASQTSQRVEQEPMYNGMSDTSSIEDSVAEPISPASERPRPTVYVRDTTSVTSESSRDLGVNLEGKLHPPYADETLSPVVI